MSNYEQIKELQKMAMKSIDQLNGQIDIFNLYLKENIKHAAPEDKKKIADVKAVAEQAINLAKMGKADEAQELIKQFENGRKGNE